MIYFIGYDIADPKRLCKVAKTLENYGLRVQKSFFECEMQENIKEQLLKKLLDIINKKEDSLVVYPLCQDCIKNVFQEGTGDIFCPKTYMVI